MNPIIIMALFFILMGLFQLSAPDFIWGQTVRGLRRRGIMVAGRTPEWERKQRRSGILFILMGVIFLTLGFFMFAADPRLMQSSSSYAQQTDGIFRTATPAYLAPVVNSP